MMSNNANDWIAFSRDDLRRGEILFRESDFSITCYFAQQASEKALKGFLVDNNVSHPRKHDLAALNELCGNIDNRFSSFKTKLAFLTQFYAPIKYPDAAPGMTPGGTPNKDLAREALDYAREVVDFCSERIREAVYRDGTAARERKRSDDKEYDR